MKIVGAINSNSEDVCERILSANCDVLLIGLRLRNRSGLEIARRIKGLNPSIPILALGFSTDVANVAEMKKSGINVFVPMHSTNDYITDKVRHARESLERCDFSGITSSARVSIVPARQ